MNEAEELRLSSHYLQERSFLFQNLQDCILRQEKEDIHQLRVTIKKLRAFFDCIEMSTRNSFSTIEHKQLLRQLFKSAGKIRELQINQELLSKYGGRSSQQLRTILDKEKESLGPVFNKELNHFPSEKLLKEDKKLLQSIANLKNEEVLSLARDYLNVELKRVRDLSKRNFEQNLHRIRKSVKAMMAIVKLIMYISYRDELEVFRVKLKSLSDDIGDWHDLMVFAQKMKMLEREGIKSMNLEHFESLIQKAGIDREMLKERVRTGIQEKLPEIV